MSDDARARDREILRRRAELLSRRTDDDVSRALFTRAAIVAAAGQSFAIPVEGLREIVPLPPVTPLPTGQPWILGLAQVRGDLLTVVDLGERLGGAGSKPRWLAVLRGDDGGIGLAVSEVIDFRDIYEDELSGDFNREASEERPISAMTCDFILIVDTTKLTSQLGNQGQ